MRTQRQAYLQAVGAQTGNFIPVLNTAAVLDADVGARFELRMRDVLPLEQATGQEALF